MAVRVNSGFLTKNTCAFTVGHIKVHVDPLCQFIVFRFPRLLPPNTRGKREKLPFLLYLGVPISFSFYYLSCCKEGWGVEPHMGKGAYDT